jgi:hypothetical protein
MPQVEAILSLLQERVAFVQATCILDIFPIEYGIGSEQKGVQEDLQW